jgi:twitching motility protein PilJ
MTKPAPKQLPVSKRQVALLGAVAVLMLVGLVGFFASQKASDHQHSWSAAVKSFSASAESMSQAGRAAPPDFQTLSAAMNNFDDDLGGLAKGDPNSDIPQAPGSVRPQVDALVQSWEKMKKSIKDILSSEAAYGRIEGASKTISQATQLTTADYQQIAQRLGEKGGSTIQTFLTAGQVVRLQAILSASERMVYSRRDVQQSADDLSHLANDFVQSQQRLLGTGVTSDPEIEQLIAKVKKDFGPIADAANAIQPDAQVVNKAQNAAGGIQANATDVIYASKTLEQSMLDHVGWWTRVLPFVGYLSGIGAVACFGLFILLFISSTRQRLNETEARDAAQQQAILGLLDEITNLANGDLTVDVTVSEDFTGAIADSINYTVQTLRTLVGTINDTSAEVVAAAASTQNIARQMNEASERQAREIAAVTNSVTASSQHLQDVSGRAEQLANRAQSSVQVAHDGAGTVGRTIQNMAALREQIQDTAKRIKRLGESSQEIGNITELINDIAEQTNTLALNASIQAATAGEAGRGFAVVADEVQRLAERAASATRQIETLVKTIQADTAEAIISMERSTANVVAGAKSAEEGGQALTQIESASQEIAKLIQEISAAARAQSGEATKIAGTMQGIREIAVQTSGSAERTSQAVGELNTLSDKLRESVAGFKLPADMAV